MNSSMIRSIRVFAVLLSLSCATVPAIEAADWPEAAVPTTTGGIRLDGVLDEPAWSTSPSIANLTQVEPRPGEPPTEATRVWFARSEDALYIAIRAEDSRPEAIVGTEMGRDAELRENDNIEIALDTHHDHRNAYYFATNAVGALVDGRITENQRPSTEWDGIWNVRTRIDERGWIAEFEIPFKTLGFDPGIADWGFNLSRYMTRGRETSRWASPSLDVELSQVVRAGRITGMENLSQGIGLDVKPYGITGFTRDIGAADRLQGAHDAGVDIFYRVTANVVSSTTINTDFAETEVDTRQVNLTRFPLFFPEKRGFFLEDAGIFEFAQAEQRPGPPGRGGGDIIPFFSRRIGLVRGQEVPIRIGEKLTGKIGRFDFGLLDVQTGALEDEDGVVVPGKNLAVGRVKANFLSQSYVGAIFTNGDPTGRVSNQVGGVDLKLATSNFLKTEKNVSLSLFGSKSNTDGVEGRDTAFGGTVSYPNDLVYAQYKWIKIGDRYDPALGFVPRKDVRISSLSSEFSPRPEMWGLRQVSVELEYNDYYSLSRQTPETKELQFVPMQLRFNSGEMLMYEWEWSNENVFDPWEISDGIVVPAAEYTFDSHAVRFMTSESRPLSIEADFRSGTFFSGTRRALEAGLTWRRGRHLTTSLSAEQNWVSLREGDFNTTLVMYRLDYSFTPFITLANFVQYDTESQDIGLQSRLRWIVQPGNEFFIVLNHSWQEDHFDRFVATQTRFRAKLNYTFRF